MLNDPLNARSRSFAKLFQTKPSTIVILHIYKHAKHIHPTYFSIPSNRIQSSAISKRNDRQSGRVVEISTSARFLPRENRQYPRLLPCPTPLLYLPRWKCGNKGTRNVEHFSTTIILSFEFKGRTGNELDMETRLIVLLIKFPNELFFNYPFHT